MLKFSLISHKIISNKMFCNKYIVHLISTLVKEDFMKTKRNIFIAFILNLSFSIFEIFGGIITGSVAIISDALHDAGDALSIGLAFILEKKSEKGADSKYTYGYRRYSLLGSLVTTLILASGSVLVIANAIGRIFNPREVNYSGMIIFAIVGILMNLLGAAFTHKGESLNQKAINLHLLEDVLGWVVVLIGAIVMNFTNFWLLDPIMSIAVALFILVNSLKNLGTVLNIFLEKAPEGVDTEEIKAQLLAIEGVEDVHHIHVRSFDESNVFASLHIVTDGDPHRVKHEVREVLKKFSIHHSTLELEGTNEHCHHRECHIEHTQEHHHHHH